MHRFCTLPLHLTVRYSAAMVPPVLILIAIATFCATMLGGLFALRFKDQLHLVLGFSAGAVIGVAFFDLLPESLSLGGSSVPLATLCGIVAFAFVAYLFVDRIVTLHAHAEEEGHGHSSLGVGALSAHSFLDGLGIGFAFQVSAEVGVIVAIAVVAHDFSDGINTINLALRNGLSVRAAFRWLLIDALAPILGVVVSLFFVVQEQMLAIILAAFCGFFIYIGASDLLPESHHRHPTIWTTVMTALGIGVLYASVSLARF